MINEINAAQRYCVTGTSKVSNQSRVGKINQSKHRQNKVRKSIPWKSEPGRKHPLPIRKVTKNKTRFFGNRNFKGRGRRCHGKSAKAC